MSIDITTLTEDDAIGGAEIIPVSDAGVPKGLTPTLIKTYIIDAIEAIAAGTATTTADKVFILQGGVMKPLAVDVLVAYAVSVLWGKAAAGALAGANLVQVQQGGVEKTVSLTNLSAFVNTTEKASILNISTLTAGTSVAGTDLIMFVNGTTPKYITVTNFLTSLWAGLAAYVTALTAVTASAGTDVFCCLQGGVAKKATLTQMQASMAASITIPPASTTETKIPQWSATSKTLTDGLALSTTIPVAGSAVDTAVPTEKAVRTLVDASVNTVAGLDIDGATDIGADLADADLLLVDDGAAGTNRKSALSRMFTYIWAKLVALTAKTTPVDSDFVLVADSAASNAGKAVTLTNLWANYLTAKATAIKIDDLAAGDDNADLNASTTKHGLLVKATAPAAGLRNVVGLDNAETAYTNKALFDATTPAAVGTGAVGSAMTAARRDHVHDALPVVAVDGTLATGANADFEPSKLVYNKTCADSDGDDVIDLHDGTIIGQVLTVYLGTKSGSDNAVITPVTALSYNTITLDTATKLATLQWQGAAVGWAILYTNGTVA
jgi:hypothetical protein